MKLKKYINCTASFLKIHNYHSKEKTVFKKNKNKVSKKKENQKYINFSHLLLHS
jgi:hypothetical protein